MQLWTHFYTVVTKWYFNMTVKSTNKSRIKTRKVIFLFYDLLSFCCVSTHFDLFPSLEETVLPPDINRREWNTAEDLQAESKLPPTLHMSAFRLHRHKTLWRHTYSLEVKGAWSVRTVAAAVCKTTTKNKTHGKSEGVTHLGGSCDLTVSQ